MNLLKHYIVSIIRVSIADKLEWMKSDFVEVEMVVNCYGVEDQIVRTMPIDEWNRIRKQGFYMA